MSSDKTDPLESDHKFRFNHYVRVMLSLSLVVLLHVYSASSSLPSLLHSSQASETFTSIFYAGTIFVHATFALIYAILFSSYMTFTYPHLARLSATERGVINFVSSLQVGRMSIFWLLLISTLATAFVILLPIFGSALATLPSLGDNLPTGVNPSYITSAIDEWRLKLSLIIGLLISCLVVLRPPLIHDAHSKGAVQTVYLQIAGLILYWSLFQPRWIGVLFDVPAYNMAPLMKFVLMLGVLYGVSYLQRAIGRRTGFKNKQHVAAMVLYVWLGTGLSIFVLNWVFTESIGGAFAQHFKIIAGLPE
jgi:hypothetical protein